MKEITFPTMVFIMVNILETKLYTCGLVDTGSEIAIFKSFVLKEWGKYLNLHKRCNWKL